MIVGNTIGTVLTTPDTLILFDEHGNEYTGVVSDERVELTATTNDIRQGKTAATDKGYTEGDKIIPKYHTCEGTIVVPNGREVILTNVNPEFDGYDFSKLQAIICVFNTNMNDSVAAEKVSINNNVYNVQSTALLSEVTKDHTTKAIKLGIVNNSGIPWIVRYITYKEIE